MVLTAVLLAPAVSAGADRPVELVLFGGASLLHATSNEHFGTSTLGRSALAGIGVGYQFKPRVAFEASASAVPFHAYRFAGQVVDTQQEVHLAAAARLSSRSDGSGVFASLGLGRALYVGSAYDSWLLLAGAGANLNVGARVRVRLEAVDHIHWDHHFVEGDVVPAHNTRHDVQLKLGIIVRL